MPDISIDHLHLVIIRVECHGGQFGDEYRIPAISAIALLVFYCIAHTAFEAERILVIRNLQSWCPEVVVVVKFCIT